MNAYYIGLMEGQHLDDIDIGIGSIAYWEYRTNDCVVIARNRTDAWKQFLEHIGAPQESVRDHMKHYIQKPIDGYWNDSTMELCFYTLANNLDSRIPSQVIEPMSRHPLCWLVQHHDKTPFYAAHWAGQQERPLWWGNEKAR